MKLTRYATLFMLAVLVVVLSGCVGGIAPLTVSLNGTTTTVVGGYADIIASTGENGATYTFTADQGTIIHTDGRRAIWKAPEQPGTYKVHVAASANGKKATSSMTIKVVEAPAYATSWTLVDDLIGGKDARVTITNNSNKTITSLRLNILMWNNFGERVSYLGNYVFRGQASDTIIQPGQSRTHTWSLYWATGVTNIVAWVDEVAFSDGTTWKAQ